jgi:hypothetical protein
MDPAAQDVGSFLGSFSARNRAKRGETHKAGFGLTKPNPGAQERRVTQSAGPYKQGVTRSSPVPPI